MSTEYSNKDDLEEFYRKKFDRYTAEPLPYAFDKINASLNDSQSFYSRVRGLLVDKYRASLLLSVMLNFALVFWIWSLKNQNLAIEKGVKQKRLEKSEIHSQDPMVEARKEKMPDERKLANPSVDLTSKKTSAKRLKPTVRAEGDIQASEPEELNISPEPQLADTIRPSEPSVVPPQDFRSNLEKYSQKKSENLRDSARELFLPKNRK